MKQPASGASLARSAGQLLIAGFDGTEPSKEILALIRAGLGGVILYRKNCVDAAQVLELTNRLQEAARAAEHAQPLLIAIDQEQGRVVRITEGVTVFPAMGAIARGGDADLIERVAAATSRELLAIGVNWNLAPVADVLSVPDCPVGDRSFGTDPAQVAQLVAAFVRGAAAAGMRTCAKHFPGHGSTGKDSHVAAPRRATQPRRTRRLRPRPVPRRDPGRHPRGHDRAHHLPGARPGRAGLALAARHRRTAAQAARLFRSRRLGRPRDGRDLAGTTPSNRSGFAALRAGSDQLIVSRMLLAERCIPGLLADLRLAIEDGTVPTATIAAALKRVDRFKQGLAWHADPAAAGAVLRAPAHLTLLEEVERRALG